MFSVPAALFPHRHLRLHRVGGDHGGCRAAVVRATWPHSPADHRGARGSGCRCIGGGGWFGPEDPGEARGAASATGLAQGGDTPARGPHLPHEDARIYGVAVSRDDRYTPVGPVRGVCRGGWGGGRSFERSHVMPGTIMPGLLRISARPARHRAPRFAHGLHTVSSRNIENPKVRSVLNM